MESYIPDHRPDHYQVGIRRMDWDAIEAEDCSSVNWKGRIDER